MKKFSNREYMKICITGGSGFIGYKLAQLFAKDGHSVLILDLHPPYQNIPGIKFIKSNLIDDIPLDEYLSCDTVIHLAGINIFSKWTNKNKQLILNSRVKTAKALIMATKGAAKGPKSFISSSAVGYYGDAGDIELTELSPAGNDFLATICKQWEEVAKSSEEVGMRWTSIRTGIVIGAGGGILQKLLPIFRYGLGGPFGSGEQWMSWIYIDDILNIYKTVVLNENISGPINATSPNPIRNKDFTKSIAMILHKPAVIHVPSFILKLILGELSDVILMSQKVIPQKLIDSQFTYICPTIEEALIKSIKI